MTTSITFTTTHTKTLLKPSTGSADKVYGADYVSPTSHAVAIGSAAANQILFSDGTNILQSTDLTFSSGVLTIGGSTAGAGIVVTGGTITTAVSPFSITETRNAAGVTFPGWTYTVTGTAQAAGSLLFKYLSGTAGDKVALQLSNQGVLTGNGAGALAAFGLLLGGDPTNPNTYNIRLSPTSSVTYFQRADANIGLMWSGATNNEKLQIAAGGLYGWGATTGDDSTDTNISRQAAGVVQVGTTAKGSTGSIRAKYQSSNGTAGVASFGPSAVTSITVLDGIITAIS